MATKNNPGAFDCYAKAEPDEPMFILLGRDKHAASLVSLWALLRRLDAEDAAVVDEAEGCAKAMALYARDHGKEIITRRDVARVVALFGSGASRDELMGFLSRTLSKLETMDELES